MSELRVATPVCWAIAPNSGSPYYINHALVEQHLRNAGVTHVSRQAVIDLYQVANAAPLFLGNVALLEKV